VVGDARERTAVLVIRLWHQRCDRSGFRARVTQTLDVETVPEKSSIARSLPQLLEMVRLWAVAFDLATTGDLQRITDPGASPRIPDHRG
jgi:hypothetical protein